MKNGPAIWFVLLLLFVATIWTVAFTTLPAAVISIALLAFAVVGTLRGSSWGIAAAKVFSWLALLASFALVVGDYEEPDFKPLAELILRRPASLTESFVVLGLAIAPWLVCLHILGRQNRVGPA